MHSSKETLECITRFATTYEVLPMRLSSRALRRLAGVYGIGYVLAFAYVVAPCRHLRLLTCSIPWMLQFA